MPAPVASWVSGTPLSAKSLVLALYSSDGSGDHPTGVLFATLRPILAEAYTRTPALTTSSGGTQTVLSTSGTTTGGLIVVDAAGLFGMTQDQPFAGYYQFLAAVKGSSGDGATAGGWTLVSHFAAIAHGATQTSVSADLLGTGQPSVTGTRQAPSASNDSTAFVLDLVNAGTGITWQPAVTIRDSGAVNATTVVSADGSGETCRMCAIWVAVSSSVAGQAVFNIGGTYPFTAPAGVFSVTADGVAAGGGGGAGNASTGGVQYGGGGAGGGEHQKATVTVTPLNNYTVIVGSGGAGGTAPSSGGGTPGPGAAGGGCQFTGDSGTGIAPHGGSGGAGATGTGNGAGGLGGTGATAGTHHDGGAGAAGGVQAAGATRYGGGGGASGGTSQGGAATGAFHGAPAPPGGGPGGAGGAALISVVQYQAASITGNNHLTVTMKKPLQQGSTVLVFLYYQGEGAAPGPLPDPAVALSDGTRLTSQVSADVTDTIRLQARLFDVYNVAGGQSGINITGFGVTNSLKIMLCEVWEVSGLGPSPQIDVSSTHTQGPASPDNLYTSGSAVTAKAPELWVAMTGAHSGTKSFNIHDSPASEGWAQHQPRYAANGGYFAGLRAAYQVKTGTGTMLYSGTFSEGLTKGTLAAAYAADPLTTGSAPAAGPGGGGGGGLGTSNNGGNGSDGQVTLSWTGSSGSGYGTPQLPAPFSNWADSATVGVAGGTTVNLNDPTGIRDVLNFLANPPILRVTQTSDTIANSTFTGVSFAGGGITTVDNYSGWDGTGIYTVRRDGLYLLHGLASFSASSSGTVRAAAVTVTPAGGSAVSYWGPPGLPTSAGECNVSKTALLDLHAGDTVELSVVQVSGGTLNLSASDPTRLVLTWLGELGAPAGTWAPPDTTFRWAAATQPTSAGGDLTALLQQHLGNDLSFLVNRPYLLAYQSTAQTGLTASAFTAVTLDKVQGPIHGGTGDPYGGWAAGPANGYTAQVPGWYLAVGEVFSATTAAAGPTVIAGLQVSSSGGVTPATGTDYYQQLSVTNASGFGGGATVYGLVYLQTGETVVPVINGNGYSGTYATNVGTAFTASFRSHLGLAWMSS